MMKTYIFFNRIPSTISGGNRMDWRILESQALYCYLIIFL